MMRMNGSSRPIQLRSQLLSGSLVVQSTLCSVSSASSLSLGKPSRTVVVNLSPLLSSPEMLFDPLVSENLTTSSFSTAVTN